jgi:hypothetical protein
VIEKAGLVVVRKAVFDGGKRSLTRLVLVDLE